MNKSGTAYIGKRNAGKTTRLYEVYRNAINNGKRVLIIDSATDHTEKSLLRKVQKEKKHILIETCTKSEIVFPLTVKNSYPYEVIKEKECDLYLCDASYFLEKGYDYPAGRQREKQRKLYKYFSIQVIQIMLDKVDVILLDEIELLPEFRDIITQVNSRGVQLVMALHEQDGIAGMDDLVVTVQL